MIEPGRQNRETTAAPQRRRRGLVDRLAAFARGVAPAGERLLTNAGLRPVAEIAPGDAVISYDPEHQVSVEREVRRVDALAPEPIWEIGFVGESVDADAATLRTTSHHRLLTPRGWRRVERLRPGDFIASADEDGERMRAAIAYVRPTATVEPVYAIAVGGDHPVIIERMVAQGGASAGAWSALAWRLRRVGARSETAARRGSTALV